MKSTSGVAKYDYSKFEEDPNWDSPDLKKPEIWGLHFVDERLHLDVDRYCEMCQRIGIDEFVPKRFLNLGGNHADVTFEKKDRFDYSVNRFRDLLSSLKKDWFEEYKLVFKLITTPAQVEDATRTDKLMYTGCSDDYDDIEIDARMEGLRRISQYEKVIRSLYCQFIGKIATEVDRYTLLVIAEHGYKGKDFNLKSFFEFTDGLSQNKKAPKISNLTNYQAYSLLHKINNFLKHNSRLSYDSLRKNFPESVLSKEDKTVDIDYQNGMFAGDWIVLKDNYIDDLFDQLIIFFENYCKVFLGEDIEASKWDYDEYFTAAVKQMSDPFDYFGLNV